ncbi:hypothetical protein RXV91_12065 [Lactiplantibacillus sp. DA1]|uniref:hypothetical protein n=1 Tax=Lactiplantibacillus sp. DA1 TaxID=3079857 RepID=UPI00292A64C8|nr:hypothetical protein [Lactiplantibacillus sp. DA1]MDV0431599.1 hypothetical protein [Lactiplantibacillus sp. DA1]
MNLVVRPYIQRSRAVKADTINTSKFSMFNSLRRIDECLFLIKHTGTPGLTDSTATLGLNLTHLMGLNVIVTSHGRSFTIIVQSRQRTFTLTGCIIEDTFYNIVHPSQPDYLISLNRQLITNSDDLIEQLYSHY